MWVARFFDSSYSISIAELGVIGVMFEGSIIAKKFD